MGGTAGADTRLIQRIPLASGAEYEEDGIHRLPIIDAGPMAPQGGRFARREQRLDALPQRVIEQSSPPVTVSVVIQMSKEGVPTDTILDKMRESQLSELRDQGVAAQIIDYMQQTYLGYVRDTCKNRSQAGPSSKGDLLGRKIHYV